MSRSTYARIFMTVAIIKQHVPVHSQRRRRIIRFGFYFFENLSCPQNVTGENNQQIIGYFRSRATDYAGALFELR